MKSLAFVFPGQGSQSVGMFASMSTMPVVRDTFEEASTVLGYDMWLLCQNNPEDKLNQTQYTQPALLTCSVAMWRAWQATTCVQPHMMAGHSLGEYSALVCSDAIDFSDGLRLVSKRGEFMQAAVPAGEGALAAIIGLDDVAVANLCDEMSQGDVLSPANYNSIGQVVIAGTSEAVARVLEVAKSRGAKLAKLLPVSVPSHSELMRPAAESLKIVLDGVSVHIPAIPVVNNVDAQISNDPLAIKSALIRQLTAPVQWVNTIKYFIDHGIDTLYECGPGNVLTGLNKRIDKNLQLTSLNDPDTLAESVESITERGLS